MKTILQAIIDEIYYPVNRGLVENKILSRSLSPEERFTADVAASSAYKGALADSLFSLIQAISISENGVSVGTLSDAQRKAILVQVNRLYEAIGEDEVSLEPRPMVFINC